MKALIIKEDGKLTIEDVAQPILKENQALVSISFAALNHRDEWIRKGQYAKIQLPAILGSDGSGVVYSVSNPKDEHWIGKQVIINPNQNWGSNDKAQSKNYNILGMPTQGTLAEFVAVDIDRLYTIPSHLDLEQSAAFPLAGLTAYNVSFNKAKISKEDTVLISGVGGGVAQFAFLYSIAVGANTYVTSSKEEVIQHCIQLGAKGGCSYKDKEAMKNMSASYGGFNVVIDSACGDGMNDLLSILNPNGRYAFYGATRGLPSNLNMRNIFWNHLQLFGSTMGSDNDFKQMVKFVEQHQIKPIIDKVFDFDNAEAAFDRMQNGEQFGKIIIKIK